MDHYLCRTSQGPLASDGEVLPCALQTGARASRDSLHANHSRDSAQSTRVASHLRSRGRGQAITKDEHRPKSHRDASGVDALVDAGALEKLTLPFLPFQPRLPMHIHLDQRHSKFLAPRGFRRVAPISRLDTDVTPGLVKPKPGVLRADRSACDISETRRGRASWVSNRPPASGGAPTASVPLPAGSSRTSACTVAPGLPGCWA